MKFEQLISGRLAIICLKPAFRRRCVHWKKEAARHNTGDCNVPRCLEPCSGDTIIVTQSDNPYGVQHHILVVLSSPAVDLFRSY
jgi:hypothetical protein